jgi:hypothetical protein
LKFLEDSPPAFLARFSNSMAASLTVISLVTLFKYSLTLIDMNSITVILNMRFELDKEKSVKIRNNPKRRIGFEEAEEIWTNPFQRRLNFMKNTLNSPNAEELARMADRGENIFQMMGKSSTL